MAKKKIKKFLKKVAPLAALALGATALGRRKQNNMYLNEEGGDRSYMRDYGPFSRTANYMPKRPMTFPAGDYSRIEDYMAKGGRVGCGKAKRGFGKAMKKGKK
jgi:hypothetical protein